MNFKLIKIKNECDEVIRFHPLDIDKVIITNNKIIIYQIEETYTHPKKYVLNSDNFNYVEWRGFIHQLRRIFEEI